jgi:uncharacterized protein YabE (DUF348 family)
MSKHKDEAFHITDAGVLLVIAGALLFTLATALVFAYVTPEQVHVTYTTNLLYVFSVMLWIVGGGLMLVRRVRE